MVTEDVLTLLGARRGHFELESGHHGDLWIDLERLCLQVAPIQRMASRLAEAIGRHRVEAICGPLVEGAFVAMMVAADLDLPFTYAVRMADPHARRLYPVRYRVPDVLRPELRGKRVAIVNDVISAGSAVRGAFFDLRECGATVTAIGSLLVLGEWAERFAHDNSLRLEPLARAPNTIWEPAACPKCAAAEALVRHHGR